MTRPSRNCRSEPQGLDLPGPEHGSSSFHLAHFPFRWCSQNDLRLRAEGVRQTSFPFASYSGSQGSKGIVSSASSSSVAALERLGVGRAPEPIPPLNSTASLESVNSAYVSYAKRRNGAALAQMDCRKRIRSWFSSVILRPELRGQPTIPTASAEFMQACRKDTIFHITGERAHNLCTVVETDQEKFVLRIGSLEKLQGGFPGLTYFVGHAAAQIEDDADGNGYVFRREILDLLLDVVFEDTEVVRIKACNQ